MTEIKIGGRTLCLDEIKKLPLEKQKKLLQLLDVHEQSKGLDKARTDYNAYLRHVWPEHIPFTDGRHLKKMGDIFNDIVAGKKKRVIINMPPRSSKSENASIYFPSFFLGKFPYKHIIQASNVSDLAVGFGRQVRDLVRSPAYQELFPGLQVKADSSAAGRWDTNKGGRYYAVGAEGNITGRGGHLVIVDDPHCLNVQTKVNTPRGLVPIGDLVVGDFVRDINHNWVMVEYVSPHMWRKLYALETEDGRVIECDDEHIWHVSVNGRPYKNLTTLDVMDIQVGNIVQVPSASGPKKIRIRDRGQSGFVCCIKIAREDGLFACTEDDIITHNTDEQIKLGNTNPAIYDSTFSWYVGTLRQRLMPGGSILVVQSRFHKRDLTGRILDHAKQNGTLHEWEIIEFPVVFPSGNLLWPEFWSKEEVDSLQRDLPPSRFASQYLQEPSDVEGSIVKKDSWRAWDQKLPDFEFKIQSWDTAFSAKDSANYSACTTWGVFKHTNSRDGKPELHAMLIHAYRERMEFTRLKKLAKEFYIDHRPDSIIVEEKATGRPLIFELQQMNIPVSSYTPTKGNDKVVRVNSVSDLFSSGKIWYVPNNQTETVIDEFTDFPSGAYDDFVDSGTQALMRFRQGLFIHTDNDETDDEDDFEYNNRSYGYY